MPVYEYRCRACGHQFDIQQSFTDDALTVCPECEGELRKVFAPVGIAFKGSGFYKTDSRSGSKPSTPAASGSGDAGGSSGSESSAGGSGDSTSTSTSSDSGSSPKPSTSTPSTSTPSSD